MSTLHQFFFVRPITVRISLILLLAHKNVYRMQRNIHSASCVTQACSFQVFLPHLHNVLNYQYCMSSVWASTVSIVEPMWNVVCSLQTGLEILKMTVQESLSLHRWCVAKTHALRFFSSTSLSLSLLSFLALWSMIFCACKGWGEQVDEMTRGISAWDDKRKGGFTDNIVCSWTLVCPAHTVQSRIMTQPHLSVHGTVV